MPVDAAVTRADLGGVRLAIPLGFSLYRFAETQQSSLTFALIDHCPLHLSSSLLSACMNSATTPRDWMTSGCVTSASVRRDTTDTAFDDKRVR